MEVKNLEQTPVKVNYEEEEEESFSSEAEPLDSSKNLFGKKWSLEENTKFCIFMAYYHEIFNRKKDRQCLRIFKKLSTFLGNRTARQCRSHFQKLMNRFKTPAKAKLHFSTILGESQFEKEYKLMSEVLKDMPIKKKPKTANKYVQTRDFSMQVNFQPVLPAELNQPMHWNPWTATVSQPHSLYYPQANYSYPVMEMQYFMGLQG